MKKTSTVYGFEFKGKIIYVGCTAADPMKRIIQHYSDAKHAPRGRFQEFLRDVNPPRIIRILELCETKIRFEREAYWIRTLDTRVSGFNTDEPTALFGRPKGCAGLPGPDSPSFGKKRSPESIEASAKTRRNRPLAPEHIEKIRVANMRAGRRDCRPVVRDDGIEFWGVGEAARQHGVTHKAIGNAITRGTRCCGYLFHYKHE